MACHGSVDRSADGVTPHSWCQLAHSPTHSRCPQATVSIEFAEYVEMAWRTARPQGPRDADAAHYMTGDLLAKVCCATPGSTSRPTVNPGSQASASVTSDPALV
jgi:hypothetical protein